MGGRREEFWELTATQRRFLKRKLCLAESTTDPCKSSIVDAHTIPRSQLRLIARDGHVYAGPSIAEMMNSSEMPLLRQIGIGKFSTLSCFCARHDKDIFSDVEDAPLVFAPRQLAVLHYRAIAGELYKKLGISAASLHNIEAICGRRRHRRNPDRVQLLRAFDQGGQIAIRDGKEALDACAHLLVERSYEHLSALVVRFKRLPSIMTVGNFYPEFDFHGRSLQILGRAQTRYQGITFNVLAPEGRAAVVMIWYKDHHHCLAFAKSFVDQRSDHYTTLAIQTAFEHIENTCCAHGWWEGLRLAEQKTLVYRLLLAGGISEGRKSNCLQYAGITHDDWGFDGLEFINV